MGSVPVDLARIRALVEPIAMAHGVRLLDVEWTTGPPGRILRVTIEGSGDALPEPERGGVTLDDCVRVSRDASTALDVEDLIPHSYHLEVSSPGLDRPLRGEEDLRSIVGQSAKVKLCRPAADGQRVLRGLLLEVGADSIRMEVDGNEHEVPLTDVVEATKVVDFGGQPRERRSERGRRGRRSQRADRRGERRNVATEAPAELAACGENRRTLLGGRGAAAAAGGQRGAEPPENDDLETPMAKPSGRAKARRGDSRRSLSGRQASRKGS